MRGISMKRNIVIPFRNTCGTNELKMCIKLIEKNMQNLYNKIYILGDECSIDNPLVENVIIEEQKYNKWIDSNFLVQYYICYIDKEPFILFNDDFFITEKIQSIETYYFSTLSNRLLTTYVVDTKINKLRPSMYGLNIMQFIRTYGDFDNYEVHIPMIVDYPLLMSLAIDEVNGNDCPALKRTMYQKLVRDKYGVINHIELLKDVKFGEPLNVIQYPFFSLTDKEFDVFYPMFEEILSK